MIQQERRPAILIINDVEETRRGIERLLSSDGYRVSGAADEREAVLKAGVQAPSLILISLNLDAVQLITMARRLRQSSGLGEEVPVVLFCVATLEEGAEVHAGHNIYMTRPDNFDQLRAFLIQLLEGPPRAG